MSTFTNKQTLDELKHTSEFAQIAKKHGKQLYPFGVQRYAELHYKKRHARLSKAEKVEKANLKLEVKQYFMNLEKAA